MTQPEPREALREKIDELNNQEVEVVDDFVSALLTPVDERLLDDSWLATTIWSEAFLARLRAHHALSQEPLSTTQFEAAFNAACTAAGWTVTPAVGATNRFYDTTIVKDADRRCLSLKASSAKAMSRTSIHISKPTEAAWIQDTRRQADRRTHLVELFREYAGVTDAIVILRAFREVEAVEYQLIEIPTTLFKAVAGLSVEAAQLATIPIPATGALPLFKIRVDRSDAKLTLTAIRLEICTVHGEWKLAGEKN